MPAIRTLQEPHFRYTPGIQADGYLQSIHLDTARAEFSLRKRFPVYTPAPLYPPPAAPSASASPQPPAQRPTATSSSQSTSRPKRKKASNAFILYRSDVLSRGLLPKSVTHQNTASVMIAERWRAEPDDVKQMYYDLAAAKKRMDDEEYARDLNIPEAPRKATRRARKGRKVAATPESAYPVNSYPQPVQDSYSSPQQQLFLPEYLYSHPVEDTASSSSFEFTAVSPSSVAESSFPPTPPLTVNSVPSESPQEPFTELFDGYSLQSPTPMKDAFDSFFDHSVALVDGFNNFENELLQSPYADVDVLSQPFDIPNIFDDPLLDFSSFPSTSHVAPSMVMADTEVASWTRVRDFVDRNPVEARPGLGFHASLLGEDVEPRPLLDENSLIASDSSVHVVQRLSSSSTPTVNTLDAKPVPVPRRLAILPGTSSAWSDAFKEFACGNTW